MPTYDDLAVAVDNLVSENEKLRAELKIAWEALLDYAQIESVDDIKSMSGSVARVAMRQIKRIDSKGVMEWFNENNVSSESK